MANPGPAVTNTNHPSNLATNQALRLLASAQSVNLNAVGDTVATLLNDSGNVSVQSIIVANASISLTTAELAVYSGPGATGTAIKTAYALSGNTSSAKVVVTAATSTDAVDVSQLFIRCTTAQGAAATADVFIYGYDLTFLP
jgi:S-formylglutathione hydrolase FrmB